MSGVGGGAVMPTKKSQKNADCKSTSINEVLFDISDGRKKDEEELREIERRQDEKHDNLMHVILGLTDNVTASRGDEGNR